MARYHEDGIVPASFEADTDLSAQSNLYRFVKTASTPNKVTLASGGSNRGPIGVLQNSPSAGHPATVKTLGHALLVGRNAGCNLKVGNYIVCASDGCAQSASAVGDADGIGWGVWLGPDITSGSAVGEALLWGAPASLLARS